MKNLFEQSRSHWVRYDRYETENRRRRQAVYHAGEECQSPTSIIP